MRKELIISITVISTLLGCNINSNTEIKPTNSPTSNPSTIVTTTSIRPEDKYCYQLYCKAISKEDIEKPKIDKPIDLAVSKDGKNVYVVNTRLGADPEGSCGNKDIRENYREVPRGYIYKITEDKKISVLKINDSYDYSCKTGGLESDKDNNLYTIKRDFDTNKDGGIRTLNYDILKLENESKISKTYPLKKEDFVGYNYRVTQFNVSKFDNTITYSQVPYDLIRTKTANKINENNSIDTLFISNSYLASFIFEDNKLNFGTSYYDGKYPYIDSSNSSYEGFKRIVPLEKSLGIRTMKMNSKKEIFALASTKGVEEINRIYKIVPDQGFEVFAGSTEAGYRDGLGGTAMFNNPSSIDFDANDNMYVADTGNNAIRKITPNGDVTTFFKQE